jgi:hypothetical protein
MYIYTRVHTGVCVGVCVVCVWVGVCTWKECCPNGEAVGLCSGGTFFESKYLELIHEEVKNKISGSYSGVEEQLREDWLFAATRYRTSSISGMYFNLGV